jgi:biopolymer transport protein ExbD
MRAYPRLRPNGELNIVPLLDVLLVLLVVLLMLAPFFAREVQVTLPAATGSSPTQVTSVDVEIQANGNLLVDGVPASLSSLQDTLRLLNPEKVRVFADETGAYGPVARAMDAVKASGVSKVSLMVK